MKKNEKGSSLIFAVVVIMVIAITVAAALAISFSYYNRSIVANTERQAYLTAKSVLTNIVDNIDAGNEQYLKLIPDGATSFSNSLEVKDFPSDMGTIDNVNLSITQRTEGDVIKEVLTISVTATYADKTQVINADFKRSKGKSAWNFERYYEGKATKGYNNVIAEELLNRISDIYSLIQLNNENAKQTLFLELSPYKEQLIDKIPGNNFNTANMYNNDLLRAYVYRILYKSEMPVLNISELTLSDAAKSKIGNGPLYIHIMFGSQSSYKSLIIYASKTKAGDVNDWQPTLIYLPDTGNWYFNQKFTGLSSLNNANAEKTYKAILKECLDGEIVQ